jgi:competence ComEA-like helix-hairpin-helix protein
MAKMQVAGLLGVCGACIGLVAVAMAAEAQGPTNDKPAQAFARICSDCHDRDRIVGNRRSKSSWDEVIDKMVEKGAVGSDEDFTLVEQYLLHNYGLVNVNRAPAAEIAEVLGVAEKDAQAIVQFRKDKGDIKDFDALCKVPNLDVEKLTKMREAIAF